MLLTEVPCVGINPESISFSEDYGHINDTSMDDEMLATRLRLLPIKVSNADHADYEIQICSLSDPDLPFENHTDGNVYYMTSDMRVLKKGKHVDVSTVFNGDFVITQLKPGQKLKTSLKLTRRNVQGICAGRRRLQMVPLLDIAMGVQEPEPRRRLRCTEGY